MVFKWPLVFKFIWKNYKTKIMKNILYFLAIITITFANGQTILPVASTEMCPNQEYTFTVSLPADYISLNSSGGAQITLFPSTDSKTSLTFKGKFSDVSGAQIFTIAYKGGEYSPKFTKVKSLFGGYKEGNTPTKITVPICQTTPITLNISGDKYWDASTSPYTAFGSINNYRYLIPSGWYLNSTLSNGSTWITASGSVTVTPTEDTGGNSSIQYVAKNDCSGNFFEGTPRYISISRPNPTFTLSPTSFSFVCGTPKEQTFTVSTPNTISCSTQYLWSLGSGNGWLYNGSPAPENFITSTNSISLTASGNVIPSTVSVTPILKGNNLSKLNCNIVISPFTSTAIISGISSYCTFPTTATYLIDAGVGNTVAWSVSNPQVANISNPTNSQVTLTSKVSQGYFILSAVITNLCGQTTQKDLNIEIGAPQPLTNKFDLDPQDSSRLFCVLSVPKESYKPSADSRQVEKISGEFYFEQVSSYFDETQSGVNIVIALTGQNPTNYPLQFRCRIKNGCEWGSWENFSWNDGTSILPPSEPTEYFYITPNPATSNLNIISVNPSLTYSLYDDRLVGIYSVGGELLWEGSFYAPNTQYSCDISFLQEGMYLVNITVGNHSESHAFYKE